MLNPGIRRNPVSRRGVLVVMFAAVCITLPLAAIHASAAAAPVQSTGGSISGTVSDSAGEKIAGATVVVSTPEGRTQGTSGMNVVLGPSVTGTVTLKLKDVPWDEALDMVATIYQLRITRRGSVLAIQQIDPGAPDIITLSVELYKNGFLLAHPTIRVLNQGTGSLGQDSPPGGTGFAIKFTPTRKTGDQFDVLVEVTTNNGSMTGHVPISGGLPGQFGWKSDADAFDVRLTIR